MTRFNQVSVITATMLFFFGHFAATPAKAGHWKRTKVVTQQWSPVDQSAGNLGSPGTWLSVASVYEDSDALDSPENEASLNLTQENWVASALVEVFAGDSAPGGPPPVQVTKGASASVTVTIGDTWVADYPCEPHGPVFVNYKSGGSIAWKVEGYRPHGLDPMDRWAFGYGYAIDESYCYTLGTTMWMKGYMTEPNFSPTTEVGVCTQAGAHNDPVPPRPIGEFSGILGGSPGCYGHAEANASGTAKRGVKASGHGKATLKLNYDITPVLASGP